MTRARPRRLRHYFSFRSPYSWLASLRLAERVPSWEGIELVPFWEPDDITRALLAAAGARFLYQPMSDAKHRYILQDVRRIAEQDGRRVAWPVDVEPWWEPAHLGYLRARELGCGPSFFWAMYRARFEQGRDIAHREAVHAVCVSVGLPADAIAAAADDGETRRLGAECLRLAWTDDVFGVPFFLHGHERFWGIDRLELFVRKLRGDGGAGCAELDRFPAVVATAAEAGALDRDHAGGCG